MSILSSSELADMRSTINTMLPDTCNLLTRTDTSDGQGGFTSAWGTASGGTAVACRLDKMDGKEVMIGDALQPFTGWMLSLPYDTTVTEQYRVEHGSYTYNVVTVNNDASWQAVKRAILERVR